MNAEKLRARQAPLKELYRATPDAARVTLLRLTKRYCVYTRRCPMRPR